MTPAGVRAWQRIVGVPLAKVDGVWGPGTDAAVRAWQAANGIEADGVIGPLCRAAVELPALIKPFEGCVLQAYDDERKSPLSARLLHRVGGTWVRADGFPCRAVPTIGWGDTAAPRRGIERCTRVEADQWLVEALERTFMPAVRRVRQVDWTGAKDSAAVSLAYNCGPGALAKVWGHGFTEAAWMAYDMIGAVHDRGLAMRREEEFALFSGT